MVRVTTDAAHGTSPRLRRLLEGDPRRFYYPFMLVLLVIIGVVLHLAVLVAYAVVAFYVAVVLTRRRLLK